MWRYIVINMTKKELIRITAIELMAQNGYNDTKIQEIANKANIAVGTIYRYYKDKQEILDYIFFYILSKKIKLLDDLELNGSTSLNTINLYLKFHIEQWEKCPNVFKILKQDGVPYSKHSVNIQVMYKKLLGKLENIVKQGQKIGEIKEIDASMVAFALLNIMNIMQVMNIIDFDFNRHINYETRKEALILFIINSIKIIK